MRIEETVRIVEKYFISYHSFIPSISNILKSISRLVPPRKAFKIISKEFTTQLDPNIHLNANIAAMHSTNLFLSIQFLIFFSFKIYKKLASLREHMVTHSDERPLFECKVCLKVLFFTYC